MMLFIDAGNSLLKWCWYDGEDLPLADYDADYGEVNKAGAELFENNNSDIDEIVLCNVSQQPVAQWLADWFPAARIDVMRSEAECCGVMNGYDNPEQLGTDRWLAILGAWLLQQEAACVVDCGTAVTIDALDENGQHQGGMIIPGLQLMAQSLQQGTDGIELEPGDSPQEHVLATHTRAAVESGSLYAVVALVERVATDLAQTFGRDDMPLLLCGGDAEAVAELLNIPCQLEPMLIFYGMIAVLEQRKYQ